jgi:hypothetical protein
MHVSIYSIAGVYYSCMLLLLGFGCPQLGSKDAMQLPYTLLSWVTVQATYSWSMWGESPLSAGERLQLLAHAVLFMSVGATLCSQCFCMLGCSAGPECSDCCSSPHWLAVAVCQ